MVRYISYTATWKWKVLDIQWMLKLIEPLDFANIVI